MATVRLDNIIVGEAALNQRAACRKECDVVHNLTACCSGVEVMFRYFEIGIPICFLKVVLSLNSSGLRILTKDEKLRLYSIG